MALGVRKEEEEDGVEMSLTVLRYVIETSIAGIKP